MTDYRVFGGVLRSDIDFPELQPGRGEPAWRLDTVQSVPTLRNPLLLGTEQVQKGVNVSLFESEGVLRLAFDDTGTFDVFADGSRLTWVPPTREPNLDLVRKDVFGRVLALALHQGGRTVLHGSAVELGGVSVGFVASKLHGKSTTVSALVAAGGRLLADDLVAVTAPPEPHVLPAMPVVHLWSDSAERVSREDLSFTGSRAGGKLQSGWYSETQICTAPTRLSALYLLQPVAPEERSRPRRTELDAMTGAIALVGHAKIGALLGPTYQVDVLSRACALADIVPVYRLEVPRDLDILPQLVREVFAWHDFESSAREVS